MADITMTLDEYEALRRLIGSVKESEGAIEEAAVEKKPMKKSPYRKELTRQQKIVQKAHPRMDFAAKAKKAHALTRKALKVRKQRRSC